MFQFVWSCFIFFCSCYLFTFIAFTVFASIYLTIVLIFLFIPNLFLLQTYPDTINSNISSTPFWFFKVCNMILQVFKVRFELQKIFYKTHEYFLDRICCCARVLVRWVEDIFTAFVNTNTTVPCFHRFFVTCIHSFSIIRRTQSLLSNLIIIPNWRLFMFVCFIFACARWIDAFLILPH